MISLLTKFRYMPGLSTIREMKKCSVFYQAEGWVTYGVTGRHGGTNPSRPREKRIHISSLVPLIIVCRERVVCDMMQYESTVRGFCKINR
ncbi:hypothetical protein SAMN05421852_101489 [Thermoflavimicrobium dichotomicum]|uniref:Uncharacterized protein n=1 Tax=Thermoflavimicrobium dichotomicum TaxID=46223 RepID=A0A1I3KJV8_9BACL|nr:hypothetical protein SAMN05421852_101489 [Thermoflavimicrobium dichotomicum]